MPTKPGWKTTEFWFGLVVPQMLALFTASGAFPSDHWAIKLAGLALSAISAAGYSISRGNVKANAPIP